MELSKRLSLPVKHENLDERELNSVTDKHTEKLQQQYQEGEDLNGSNYSSCAAIKNDRPASNAKHLRYETTDEQISVATSSAYAGENVVECGSFEKQIRVNKKKGDVETSPIRTVDGCTDGINNYSISPKKLSNQMKASKKDWRTQRPYTVTSSTDRNSSSSQNFKDVNSVDNTKKNNSSKPMVPKLELLSYTKKWILSINERRKQDALASAVEKQRQHLLQQTKSIEEAARRAEYGDHYVDEEAHIRDRVERGQIAQKRGLEGNETFRNIMLAKTMEIKPPSFCSVLITESHESSDDEFYELPDARGLAPSGSDEKEGDFLLVDMHNTKSIENKLSTSNVPSSKSLKISNAEETFSGCGMTVQIQVPDSSCKIEHAPKQDILDFNEIKIVPEIPRASPDTFILSPSHMKMMAADALPSSITYSQWKRLYSLQRDGDSFEGSFLKKVAGQRRTLLVIKTTRGEILGGYTECPWESQPCGSVFYGSGHPFLFGIKDNHIGVMDNDENNKGVADELKVYKWTGSNHYMQMCDVHSKKIALGGGGGAGMFGLCIEDDFANGSTGACETYGNEPLCQEDCFQIMDVECWGFVVGF